MHDSSLQAFSFEEQAVAHHDADRDTMSFECSPESIPTIVRESYIQQKLPVRNQSLAAFTRRIRPSAAASLELTLTHTNAILQSHAPKGKRLTVETHQCPQVQVITNGLLQPNGVEDEEFNFKDRPPSFVSYAEPINPPNATRGDTTDSNFKRVDLSASPEPLDQSSNHYARSKLPNSRSDPIAEWGDHPRVSCDTVMTEQSEMHSSITPHSSMLLHMNQREETQGRHHHTRRPSMRSDSPPIHLALLSRVAKEMFRRATISTMTKDNIEYHNVFSGSQAIDCLLQVLHTKDRNLALLVGRALDSQNFIHDVNYEHRLRDSSNELYCFKAQLDVLGSEPAEYNATTHNVQDTELPNGVFTVLTDCYSPTCSREYPCYSVHCPRKTKKLLNRAHSNQSSHSKEDGEDEEERKLWVHSVPNGIVELTSVAERNRQECIYELIHTEAAFVEDLRYIHKYWVEPLVNSPDIIPFDRRVDFVQEVFWNIADIEKVNSALSNALDERQRQTYVVASIGDVLLTWVCHFAPFVLYGAHQVIGKFKFELEKRQNPRFAEFVYMTERLPVSRRLELNGYLTKPTTRLGRYNLILREILQRTPPDNPDIEAIPKVMAMITRLLVLVNAETGKCDNTFNLQQIRERLSFKSTILTVDLQLGHPDRKLLLKGRMRRKGNSSSGSSEVQVFLFDHYIVFAKIKHFDFLEHYKVYRKPIPLELLSVSNTLQTSRVKRTSIILPYSRSMSISSSTATLPYTLTPENYPSMKARGSPITFYHHGRHGSSPLTLYCSNPAMKKTWIDQIAEQQRELSAKRCVFNLRTLSRGEFPVNNRVLSTAVLKKSSGSPKILFGTDQGVFLDEMDAEENTRRKVVPLDKVSQIEILDDNQLLVLAEKTLLSFPLDTIEHDMSHLKQGRTVSQNTTFFHVGRCMDRMLICIVKASTPLAASTIRVLEPVLTEEGKKQRSLFSIKRLVRNDVSGFKLYKDLYLPSEASAITLLKTKMCTTCPREIGVVDMSNFGVQTLLDPQDEALDFVNARQDIRPVTIYRLQIAEYLVCYTEFAFLIDQRGRLKRPNLRIEWEGTPRTFALSYPYIIAFEPSFIEIHSLLTGKLEQVIRGTDIRCTNINGAIHGSMNDPHHEGFQLVFQLEKGNNPVSETT